MHSTIANLAIILLIVSIFISLGYGLFNLLTSTNSHNKLAKALTYRISLSLVLFGGLVLAVFQGWIIPNPPLL